MTDFRALLEALLEARVDFILVGGGAAVAHGSARLTLDLDVVDERRPENLERLATALAPLGPCQRQVPPVCRPGGTPRAWRTASTSP